ncbi:AraC family transcriptional regulator [Paenibacillus polymyxa]|uniref:helix-turn-helix domain-containing protein n=1 Tax=Paenibacillus polymyxa TaxID=1406 RepID=UPI001BED377F|nr:AraC family transcriptional regulator [Paenibacillus polymyxa]MBT2287320.1 AraC family transcriptional regulator [Paenibacillus polymyxa]
MKLLLHTDQEHEIYSLSEVDFMEAPVSITPSSEHRLLIVVSGNFRLHLGEETLTAIEEQCFYIRPGGNIVLTRQDHEPFAVYMLSFHVIKVQDGAVWFDTSATFDRSTLRSDRSYSSVHTIIQNMIRQRPYINKAESSAYQPMFHMLMLSLSEHNTKGPSLENARDAVKRTLIYLQEHYAEKIKVQELSDLSGVSLWQYNELFRSLTDKTPIEYLTEIRLNRAKELLLQTEETIESIAHQVGFNDHYYFVRRFRQKTGLPPREYAAMYKQSDRDILFRDSTGRLLELPKDKSRIVYLDRNTVSDLIVLNLFPVGSPKNLSGQFIDTAPMKNTTEISFPPQPEEIRKLKPDLILVANYYGISLDEMTTIAPTIVLNREQTLDSRLRTLGQLFDKEQEAERWLIRYDAMAEYMWKLCKDAFVPGESASVLVHADDGRLYVMASHGLPNTLYHANGFRPPLEVTALIEQGEAFISIEKRELERYMGDRIFIISPHRDGDVDDPTSYECKRSWMNSHQWSELTAVCNGKVYHVGQHWNMEGALERMHVLHALPELLRGTMMKN